MILRCTACQVTCSPHRIQTICPDCGKPLMADYSFGPGQITREDLEEHPSLWRYAPFLPSVPPEKRISIGEGHTPLHQLDFHDVDVYLKDETTNPTGSFKDRGMCLAITMARLFGRGHIVVPSAGNAAVSAATYANAGHLTSSIYLPETIPPAFIRDVKDAGGSVVLSGENIAEAAATMREAMTDAQFDVSTLKEPYRVEGKKTMGLEIAEQLDWSFPDVVVYPTGGGTGLVGIYKAMQELQNLDWVRQRLPRMVAIQTTGCAPVVTAFHEGAIDITPFPNPSTKALGLNVPSPAGGAWMLATIRESGGTALAVHEEELDDAQQRLRDAHSGMRPGPEAAAAWRGMEFLLDQGWIKPGERVVVVVTGDDRRYS